MIENSFKLGRISGIEVGVHYTWLFAFALVTWSLAVGFFPLNYPDWSTGLYWLLGVIAALALFASVLIHELSHSFMALARGQAVRSITLFIFGGVSNIEKEAEQPQDEFLVAVVGPLTSFILAGVFWALQQLVGVGDSPVSAVLGYLALINLLLGGFNLVPGFPLDGGRVLRSIIWGVTGSLRRSTNIASYVGQAFGFLLIFWGVFQIFGGALLSGLWIAFIGWFLNNAAESTRRQQVLQENLSGVPVTSLMNTQPPIEQPTLSVRDFVFDRVLRDGERAVLVADDGRLLGIVSIVDVKQVPQEAWAETPIGRIMTPAPLKTVSPDTDIGAALNELVDGSHNQLPVVENGRLVGMLSRSDILRFLQVREELDIRRLPSRGWRRRQPEAPQERETLAGRR